MDFLRLNEQDIDSLWQLHCRYKAEIGEDAPTEQDKLCLTDAIRKDVIRFYGCRIGETLAGCCSVTRAFSTFSYSDCGSFEDFYILPEYRHRGTARALVQYAYTESGVASLTVTCADCDREMYLALGFSLPLGTTLAMTDM